ncbi:sigma-70 family RNA polymerase sigma factor [Sediminibacillus terrae]|uniref:sigma-70 family RNA polymerase sigma factor n=1 Tax=Sediminibacillus terrae TaxID=1562106 RepID=UPI001386F227|nr:sigma-70 family RNA polymerase sigma factor [Sediminibacillus terrae]
MRDNRDIPIPFNQEKVHLNEQEKELLLKELMASYSQKVFLLAYSFVQDHGMAEDISQEVFIKCYQNLNQYRGEASLSTWLYRITANTSKDVLRKNKLAILMQPWQFFEAFKRSESPEVSYLKQDQREEVLQSIFSLPIKYREILILYYFHEQKVEEIAVSLAINSNTVRTRLVRGRERLKQVLTSKIGE